MPFPVLLLLFVLSVLVVSSFCHELSNFTRRRNSTGCLTRFESNPEYFDPCINEVCFLFREQQPYVRMDPSMDGEQDQKLFRCQAPSTYFPELSGIAFELHKKLAGPDFWCVWAGKDCMFNNMVDFVEIQANRSRHQFAISGILLETSQRVSSNLFPSSPVMDSRMVVIGRRTDDDVAGTLDQLTKAFKRETWVLIAVVFLVYLVFIVAHVLVFCPEPLSPEKVFFHFMGDRQEDVKSSDGKSNTLYRASLWFLKTVIICTLVLVVTFYELAAVNYLFIQKDKKLGKSVSNLSDAERSEYAVLKASAVEHIWIHSIDAQVNDTRSWHRCHTETECFARVLGKKYQEKYMFSADLLIRYAIRKQCDALTVYETEDRMYQCGAGLIFGGKVPAPVRLRINREILDMRMAGEIGKIVEKVLGGPEKFQCRQNANNIGPAILGLPLAFLAIPLLLPLAVLIVLEQCRSCSRRRRQKPRAPLRQSGPARV